MNIAYFFESDINPILGGTERVTWSIAQYLMNRGHNIYFISHQKRSNSDTFLLKYHVFLPDSIGYDSEINICFLKEFIAEKQIDVLINQGALSGEAKICSKSILGDSVKIITVLHFSPYDDLRAFSKLFEIKFEWNHFRDNMMSLYYLVFARALKQKAINNRRNGLRNISSNSDAVVLLSKSHIKQLLTLVDGLREDILHVIPNPNTYRDVGNITAKEKKVLYVGRLIFSQKRVDWLIKIWSHIEPAFQDWQLIILGDGPSKEDLVLLSEKLNLKNIQFVGYQDPARFYRDAQILCLTSTSEGFGMVLTEAMQHQVVPMAFDSFSALHDIVTDKKTGIIIPPFDILAYSEQLAALMRNTEFRSLLAKNAAIKTEDFDIEKVGCLWEELLDNIINKQ